jgi:hypothetical protein
MRLPQPWSCHNEAPYIREDARPHAARRRLNIELPSFRALQTREASRSPTPRAISLPHSYATDPLFFSS